MPLLFLTFALAFLAGVLITPRVREHARRRGILDIPDRERKLHSQETPLAGGFAVFLSALTAITSVLLGVRLLVNNELTIQPFVVPLMFASLVILVVGLADDVLKIRIRQKILGQCVAIGILIASGIRFDAISLLQFELNLGLLSIPLTMVWLLFTINSLNLLDGADGFASTIGLVLCVTLAAMSYVMGNTTAMIVASAMAGALAGFLIFNFPPSSIFLGDSGSMLIGLVLGTLAMQSNVKSAASFALATPVALFAIPLLDSLAAVARRTLTGRSLAVGDRAHIHHAMMRRGFGPRRLVLAAVVLSLIPAVGAILSIRSGSEMYAWGSLLILAGLLVGGRLFGFNELQLITNRSVAFCESLLFRTTGLSAREKKLGLLDSAHCEELWQQLTGFAEEHGLTRVRFDLKGSWMDDGRDVLWEHVSRQHTGDNWQVSVPVFAKERAFGTVHLTGGVFGNSGQHMMAPMGELLDSIGPLVEELVDDAASQGVAMQQGLAERVLFINRSYWPDVEATGQLLTELCEDLSKEGFAVSVLAGQPNHVTDAQQAFHRSGVQRRNGVDIYRVRHTKFNKSSMFGKAMNLLSFTAAATWQSFFIPRHEVVVVESDPFLLAILGGWIKRWRESRLVVYVQDVYPDVAVQIGKVNEGSIITRLTRSLMSTAYERADCVITLGNCMKRRLVERGVSPTKIRVIPNWADTRRIYPIKEDNPFRQEQDVNDKFVVMHSGNMGLTQELDQILDVADRLRDNSHIVFMLIGDGAMRPRLQQQAQARKLENVRFLPYQPRENLAKTLSAADLHFVSMHPRVGGCLVPSKFYGIIASGSPVLAVVPSDADQHQLVQQHNIGFVATPGDVQGITQILADCASGQYDLQAMGQNARELAESQFDRSNSVLNFGKLLGEFFVTTTTVTNENSEATLSRRFVAVES